MDAAEDLKSHISSTATGGQSSSTALPNPIPTVAGVVVSKQQKKDCTTDADSVEIWFVAQLLPFRIQNKR